MLCQHCQKAEATHRVTERSKDGRFVESQFCATCCKQLAGLPDPPERGLHTLVDRLSGTSRVLSFNELVAWCDDMLDQR
jgi:protein-arginine kinase activator protein McsA